MIQKTRKKQAVIANPRLALARDRSRISLYIPEVLSASTSQKSYQPLHPRSFISLYIPEVTEVIRLRFWYRSHAKKLYFLCQSVRLSPKLRLCPMQLKSRLSAWTLNRTCQTLRKVLTWLHPMQLKSRLSGTTWTLNRTCQTLRRVLTWLQKTLFSHCKAFGLMPKYQIDMGFRISLRYIKHCPPPS